MTSTLEKYHDAVARLDRLIDLTPTPTDSSRAAVHARARERMDRLRDFLARLDDPHRGRPLVHIGGTSGKGSTSTVLAAILTAAGYRTALHTSPYLQTAAEKLQINGQLVAMETFIDLVQEFEREHEAWIADGHSPLTYGEAFNALTWLFFRRENAGVGIVEVGAGGRLDLTNILTPILSVITSVGIDHTQTLGDTIAQIAWHKAGILKPGVPALSGVPDPEAQAVIKREALEVGSELQWKDMDEDLVEVVTGPEGTTWTDAATGDRHAMTMSGRFQARNGQLAIEAARLLRDQGFDIPDAAISAGLRDARIPGRAERVPGEVPVLLDGAHNAEKIAAFAADVPALLPVAEGSRRIGVMGILAAKHADEMLGAMLPVVDDLVVTSPQVYAKNARSAEELRQSAHDAGFSGRILAIAEPGEAMAQAMAMARPGEDAIVVIGSLYLVGNVRGAWYREAAILEARTPWPTPPITR